MLLRFAAENIMSFKDTVEFNTFPSSKSHSHDWHKINCAHVTALRMSAIYGANGAGKSNLLKCISLLKSMVSVEKLSDLSIAEDLYFKLNDKSKSNPSELAIEFYTGSNIFYYHVTFNRQEILGEELLLSQKTKDITIFRRKDNDVTVSADYMRPRGKNGFIETFLDAMNRIIRPDMSALSFFGRYYPNELPMIKEAYNWITNIQIVVPSSTIHFLPHLIDVDNDFATLVNSIIPELKTGITKLSVKKEVLDEKELLNNSNHEKLLAIAKEKPGTPVAYKMSGRREIGNLVMEDGIPVLKTLYSVHTNSAGQMIDMSMDLESDGTRRLVEYMPLLYSVLKSNNVFIVDEIERSIHPIMIKSIMRKISESKEAKGQIIFTTHESCLLDQSIFRPDEIWFAQKDIDQSTQLYPLSDYNIHKTANIENGYLNGRYGGIPFLSNLTDLKW